MRKCGDFGRMVQYAGILPGGMAKNRIVRWLPRLGRLRRRMCRGPKTRLMRTHPKLDMHLCRCGKKLTHQRQHDDRDRRKLASDRWRPELRNLRCSDDTLVTRSAGVRAPSAEGPRVVGIADESRPLFSSAPSHQIRCLQTLLMPGGKEPLADHTPMGVICGTSALSLANFRVGDDATRNRHRKMRRRQP
jgi:hypothetical protein